MGVLESIKHVAIAHPFLTGTAAIIGIAILILRKIHYRFIVYPSISSLRLGIGGRHNN